MRRLVLAAALFLAATPAMAISPDREPEPSAGLPAAKIICDYRATAKGWQSGFEDCATINGRWDKYKADMAAWRMREDQKRISAEIEAVHQAARP